jgi:hypothetical protein
MKDFERTAYPHARRLYSIFSLKSHENSIARHIAGRLHLKRSR